MLIFFDSEFTGLGLSPKLISIGFAAENGVCFYAELSDAWRFEECSEFVRQQVLPLLAGGSVLMTLDQLSLNLGHWLEQFEEPIQLVTDSVSWDWPWIEKIFYLPGTWPSNLDRQVVELPKNTTVETVLEASYTQGLRRHHALDDAQANRLAWIALQLTGRDHDTSPLL